MPFVRFIIPIALGAGIGAAVGLVGRCSGST